LFHITATSGIQKCSYKIPHCKQCLISICGVKFSTLNMASFFLRLYFGCWRSTWEHDSMVMPQLYNVKFCHASFCQAIWTPSQWQYNCMERQWDHLWAYDYVGPQTVSVHACRCDQCVGRNLSVETARTENFLKGVWSQRDDDKVTLTTDRNGIKS
jgi:hypothetical protein